MWHPDLGLQLLRSGYDAVRRNAAGRGGDHSYRTRLAGRRALVVWGAEGARLFYDETLLRRAGAIPAPLARLLFGRGAVHGLDGEAHRDRKAMFLALLDEEHVRPLVDDVRGRLDDRVATWGDRSTVSVFDELVDVYGACVLAWAGIELWPEEAARRSHDLATIVDGSGGSPVALARAWAARRRCDRWATGLVERTRDGRLRPPPGSVLQDVACGRGAGLDAATAGVELLNILRPTVAVAWLGTFAALALDVFPEWREPLSHPDRVEERLAFAQEVRRTAPFAPVLAARVVRPGRFRGEELRPGTTVVLDLLSTDHDEATWPDATRFLPQRFADRRPDAYELVPQGGGPATGHRCPGEPLTLALLAETVGCLAGVGYDVVSDASYDPRRVPTVPRQGLRVRVGDPAASPR